VIVHRGARSNVQVRGCGCCLPLAVGMASLPVLALRALLRALAR
jgi:hypothetical protein